MKLKELRISSNKRPEDIARLLNISVQSYYRYESDQNEPNLTNLVKMADYFGVTLDYLVGRPFANDAGYLTENEKTLLKVYRSLNNRNQQTLLDESKGILLAQSL